MNHATIGSSKCAAAIILLLLAVLTISTVDQAVAGPQHWGYGMSYLATLKQVAGRADLVVYEGPLRAKNQPWLARWIDRTTDYSTVVPGGLAVGNFWPADQTKDYPVIVSQSGTTVTVKVLDPPEIFKVGQWPMKKSVNLTLSSGTVIGTATGDLLGLSKDQLVLIAQDGASLKAVIVTAATTPISTDWAIAKQVNLPTLSGEFKGAAIGNFWGDGVQSLAVATSVSGATQLSFYSYNNADSGSFSLITTDAATDLPVLAQNGLIAGDYVKDMFDDLTLIPADSGTPFQLRTAPARPGQAYNPGPWYTGKAVSLQTLPGNSGASSTLTMTGTFADGGPTPTAFAAGRTFGYCVTVPGTLNDRLLTPISNSPDAEISFMHRTPLKDEVPASNYGWPSLGQTVNWEINVKSNGANSIPANRVTLKIWVNTPYRNADTNPTTMDTPDYTVTIPTIIPSYDGSDYPTYGKVNVSCEWPYDLISVGPGATWMKINIETVGERWLVVDMSYVDSLGNNVDTNQRNNRYEAMIAGKTFRPQFIAGLLAQRHTAVTTDPSSIEYLGRKLADANLCMWERSGTGDNEDGMQWPWFDSYQIGFPDSAQWTDLNKKYEGNRGLGGWFGGPHETYERFNWEDGGNELHETGHLYCPLDDLYGYGVSPEMTMFAKMADGSPSQLCTWVWYPDSFGSGHAHINVAGMEVDRLLYGTREKVLPGGWNNYIPKRVYARVLDRNGNPVPNANVKVAWLAGQNTPSASGTTDSNGRWELTWLFGTQTVDHFGRTYGDKYANGSFSDSLAQVFTVQIGNYQDCDIWGMRDITAQSRITTLYHSFVDPDEWTWDFKTNYEPGVPDPAFTIETCVQGDDVAIGVTGQPGATYKVYRRWEPTYARTLVGTYTSPGTYLKIMQNTLSADSFGSGRTRATYEITQVSGGVESLPRVTSAIGMGWTRGITATPDGKLLVALNRGQCTPVVEQFNGTTPYAELINSWRFGHTVCKSVASRLRADYWYNTLLSTDMTDWWPDFGLDMVEPRSVSGNNVNAANYNLHGFWASNFSSSSPYTCTINDPDNRVHPGDLVDYSNIELSPKVNVLSRVGNVITTDLPVMAGGSANTYINVERIAGRSGSDATRREMLHPRGLDTIVQNSKEYIVIADTGNQRVMLLDDKTGYVTKYDLGAGTKPAAIATHPMYLNKFFMLDRHTDRNSKLYLMTFNGTSITVDAGYPVSVAVGDYSDDIYYREMGLAAVADPATGNVVLAVTDASQHKALEYKLVGTSLELLNTYTQAVGTYVGSPDMQTPLDAAYSTGPSGLTLFSTDATLQRVVRLAARTFSTVAGNDAKSLPDGTVVQVSGVTTAIFSTDALPKFYIESTDRSSGIQVRCTGTLPTVNKTVTFMGTMGTDGTSYERYVQITSWTSGATKTITPVAVTARSLGGGAFGLQPAVLDGEGLNNVGLLVKAYGEVTSIAGDYSYFYISDGSGVSDGSGPDGIKVDMTAIISGSRPHPVVGDRRIVTGISTTYAQGADICRMVRMRSASDLRVL